MTRARRGGLLLLVGGAGLVALVVAVNPRSVADAAARVGLVPLPLLAAISVSYYLLQGLRWHLLLGAAGIELPLRRTMLLSLAGQSAGLLPAGEVTRVALVADEAGSPFAAVLATVTVQELVYTLLLVALALPAAASHPGLAVALIVAEVGTGAVLLLLAIPWLWRPMRGLVARTPLLHRLGDGVDLLQTHADRLLRRPDTLAWSAIGLLQAALAVTLFWLVVHLLSPGTLGWSGAALAYALSHVAGALSAIPGGIGAYEASVTGLLAAAGVDTATAAAAAILHRAADKGLATLVGVVALAVSRRRVGDETAATQVVAGPGGVASL